MDPSKLQTYIVLSLADSGRITLISVLCNGCILTGYAKFNRVEITWHIDTVLHDMGHMRVQFRAQNTVINNQAMYTEENRPVPLNKADELFGKSRPVLLLLLKGYGSSDVPKTSSN